MDHASKRFGLWLVCIYILAGCISISPASLTSTPTIELPALRPTATGLPARAPTPTMSVVPTKSAQIGKDAATFIRETYPDYSGVALGEKFVKSWDVKNIGTNTWNTNYVLVVDAVPQKGSLGSPAKVNFPQETPPGGTVTLSVPLVAPVTPGTYSVYWKLENDRGESFGVDGDRVWVTIIVCEVGKACSPPVTSGSTSENGITATLTNVIPGPQSTIVSFCMTLPSSYYDLGYPVPSLLVDQKTVNLSSGGSTSPHGCYQFEYPISAAEFGQAQHIVLSIDNVRISPARYPDEDCQSARADLVAKYPGLNFQCHFSMAGYFTNLQLPAGMTREQAQQIIVDAIEGAIYGPWVITVKP